ncbi:MAG: leishmanolysin-related zinc metalloendopeptidase [Gemmatimonadaceae bacterium]
MKVVRLHGSILNMVTFRMRPSLSFAFILALPFLSACGSDPSGPVNVGALTHVAVQSGDAQTALAGATVGPIVIAPEDANGLVVPGQTATFSVIAGGGTIANTTGTVNPDGTITAPSWTLGKSAVPQQLQVTVGGFTTTISATVQTAYKIQVVFYGRPLSANEQALFTNAAARIRALVVGAVPDVTTGTASPDSCGARGAAPLPSTIQGVIIYAAIDSIDGPGKTLAQSGPCYIRVNNGQNDWRTSVGVMGFDSADFHVSSPNVQETITHEMMHVLGFGVFWDSNSTNLLINNGTPAVAYTGAGGIAGCKAIGGTVTCASSVPVEGTQGGPGTLYSHWRESTFGSELMTGFIQAGTNPLSAMSIRSLEDLGYTVNANAADAYRIPGGSLTAAGATSAAVVTPGDWERRIKVRPRSLPTVGLPLTDSSK